MSDAKKTAHVGALEVHLYGGLFSLAAGGAAWFAQARPLGAFLVIAGAGLFYIGRMFLRRG